MTIETVKEKWVNKVNEVVLGAGTKEGGTRSKIARIGGQGALPFMFQEGEIPNGPVVAMEVWDTEPKEWPETLKGPFGSALKNPCDWAKKCVNDFGADLICLVLEGANPEGKNCSADEAAETVRKVLKATGVPLVIIGCQDKEKDTVVLPACSHAAKGENCLMGMATQDNYKTLAASCLADGHSIIAESPIDINIAKQVNILITDMGFNPGKIVMHPTTGALGYGMEYAYSIMERGRLAALMGDKMLSMPFILFVGGEAWKVKEQSALWEATTAACMLQSGADILVMRHPEAVKETKALIGQLTKK